MNKKHAKSSCCDSLVIRFGQKRRQCTGCRRTWRIRPKKVGRKTKRSSCNSALKFLLGQRLSSYSLSRSFNISEDTLNRNLKNSLREFNRKTSYPPLPTSRNLIVIADAMVQQIEDKRYAIYFVLVKSHRSEEAYIAPAHYEEGMESCAGWLNAFNDLPQETLKNIVALVSDGHKGLVAMAKENDWLMQRCHFHIIAHLQGRRSKSKFSRHRQVGEEIFKLANNILVGVEEKNIQKSMDRLEEIKNKAESPVLKRLIRGFIKQRSQFRTYLDYPELNLPKTSNSAESLVSCVRNLLHRTKGFRTEKSLKEWIEGMIKCKRKIKNNGSHQPN